MTSRKSQRKSESVEKLSETTSTETKPSSDKRMDQFYPGKVYGVPLAERLKNHAARRAAKHRPEILVEPED